MSFQARGVRCVSDRLRGCLAAYGAVPAVARAPLAPPPPPPKKTPTKAPTKPPTKTPTKPVRAVSTLVLLLLVGLRAEAPPWSS